MISKTTAVQYEGCRERAEQLGERLPEEAWVSVATEGQSEPAHQWVCLPLSEPFSEPCAKGRRRWLLIRRPREDPRDLAYYLAYGPDETPVQELVRVCDRCWAIEEDFAEAKGEVGLDQYEVRSWTAWHRFITLCLLAHAALVVLRQRALSNEATAQKGALRPTACHSPCLKSAGCSSRCANRLRSARSASTGRTEDGLTRQWQPAATPRGGRSTWRGRDPPKRHAARSFCPPPRSVGSSATPTGSASARCSPPQKPSIGADPP